MSFKKFQDGLHLGYRNGTNLAILNFRVAPIPPTKEMLFKEFQERNDLNNSKSTCCPNASYQVSVQSGLGFGGDVENVKS